MISSTNTIQITVKQNKYWDFSFVIFFLPVIVKNHLLSLCFSLKYLLYYTVHELIYVLLACGGPYYHIHTIIPPWIKSIISIQQYSAKKLVLNLTTHQIYYLYILIYDFFFSMKIGFKKKLYWFSNWEKILYYKLLWQINKIDEITASKIYFSKKML